MSATDYPEHLNPFDDNYTGAEEASSSQSRHKYNTWSGPKTHRVTTTTLAKPKLLGKTWATLNISPSGKLVRKLSILKTAVERFASKKKKSFHSNSFNEVDLPPRSHSVHDDFSFRIISPKLKEKIRQQAFSKSINNQPQEGADSQPDASELPHLNGRLSPQNDETEERLKTGDSLPASPELEKEFQLGARPRTRKKRPPPPPPVDILKASDPVFQLKESEKAEDSQSVNSSITQDLENDATSDEDNSKTEVCDTIIKETDKNL